MFATKDRPPHHAAVSCRPLTVVAFLPATPSEFSPADITPEQRKINALCFDILTGSFCRKPPVLILIQFARGCTPSLLCCLVSMNYKTPQRRRTRTGPNPKNLALLRPRPGRTGAGCTCSLLAKRVWAREKIGR